MQISRADVLQADALQLPYRSASCDAALCIAVLHHISSEARRLQLMGELVRILRPGGKAIVSGVARFGSAVDDGLVHGHGSRCDACSCHIALLVLVDALNTEAQRIEGTSNLGRPQLAC
eukprot:1157707-Pelagomonas_calceolata.AAC.15